MRAALLRDLARAKAIFQQRAIVAHITGAPAPSCKACGRIICDHKDPEYAGVVSPVTPTRHSSPAVRRGRFTEPPEGTSAGRNIGRIINGANGSEPGTYSHTAATHGSGSAVAPHASAPNLIQSSHDRLDQFTNQNSIFHGGRGR